MEGIVLMDKPQGLSSRRVVNLVGRALKVKKVGHLGTLDPFATGVLIVVVGKATRMAPFLEVEPKEYEATLALGTETDTQDLTGRMVRQSPIQGIDQPALLEVMARFSGAIRQIAPAFSALKHQGVALYKLARMGKETPKKERTVTIQALEVTQIDLPLVSFKVVCSGGTYVRTLAHDIGQELGCGAHLVRLRRVRCGIFSLNQCISLDDLKEGIDNGLAKDFLIPLSAVLINFRGVEVEERIWARMAQGRDISVKGAVSSYLAGATEGERVRILSVQGDLLGLAEVRSKLGELFFHPLRVLM